MLMLMAPVVVNTVMMVIICRYEYYKLKTTPV